RDEIDHVAENSQLRPRFLAGHDRPRKPPTIAKAITGAEIVITMKRVRELINDRPMVCSSTIVTGLPADRRREARNTILKCLRGLNRRCRPADLAGPGSPC